MKIEKKDRVYDANYDAYIELIDRIECVKDAIKKQNYGIAMDILYKPCPEFQITTSTEPTDVGDERIRKMLIKFFSNGVFYDSHTNGIPDKDIVAWLEKQGKIVAYYEDRLDECAHKYFNKGYSYKHALEKQSEPIEINPTEFDTRLQSLIGKFNSLPKEELIGSLSFWLNVVQNDGIYKE